MKWTDYAAGLAMIVAGGVSTGLWGDWKDAMWFDVLAILLCGLVVLLSEIAVRLSH